MLQVEAIDAKNPLLGLLLTVVLYDWPLLQVATGDETVQEVLFMLKRFRYVALLFIPKVI